MRTTATGLAEQTPHRPASNFTVGTSRRGELAAGLATAVVLAQLAGAPLILVLAAVLATFGRITRWPPRWLLLPAGVGAGWLICTGPARPYSAFAAGVHQSAVTTAAAITRPSRLADPASVLTGAGHWLGLSHRLAVALPLMLVAAAGQAAIALWLSWYRNEPDFRPGPIASARRRGAIARLGSGHGVTADGCAIGVASATGALTGFSWSEAEYGVMLAGRDGATVETLALAVVAAALRRRKTVLILDLTVAGPGEAGVTSGPGLAALVAAIAASAGAPAPARPAAQLAGTVSTAIGLAVRARGVVLLAACNTAEAEQLMAGLAAALVSLRDLGLRGDCLAWVSGCEAAGRDRLSALLNIGPATGTAILLSTTSKERADELAPAVGLIAQATGTGPAGEFILGGPKRGTRRPASGHAVPLSSLPPLAAPSARPDRPRSGRPGPGRPWPGRARC